MKAIKIDVENQSVYEIELEKGLRPIYNAIGNDCSLIEAPIRFKGGDALFCDEEILFRREDWVGAFSIDEHLLASPIVNNAIIIGSDEEGDSTDCVTTVDYIKERIKFYRVRERA